MRGRGIASVGLIVLGAVLLALGTVAYYARTEVAGREIVVNLVDRGSTDLVAARPLLESPSPSR